MQFVGMNAYTLPYVEEVVVSQDLRTSAMEINPYDNFIVMPGALSLNPAIDFWTEEQTAWTSPETREFAAAPNQPPGQSVLNEVTELRRVNAVNLRQIPVTATIEGFAAGENLATLTFDGVDVKPAGTQTANIAGVITVTFTIPANIPVGRRLVRATGAADSFAETIYVGEGTIDITTMRRVTLVTRAAPQPVIINNVTNVIKNTVVNNIKIINQITQPVIISNNPDPRDGGSNGGGPDPLAQTFRYRSPGTSWG